MNANDVDRQNSTIRLQKNNDGNNNSNVLSNYIKSTHSRMNQKLDKQNTHKRQIKLTNR